MGIAFFCSKLEPSAVGALGDWPAQERAGRIKKLRKELAARTQRENQIATAPQGPVAFRAAKKNWEEKFGQKPANGQAAQTVENCFSLIARQSADSLVAPRGQQNQPHPRDNCARSRTPASNS